MAASDDRRVIPGDELDGRARQILRAVVQEYVETGEPVASNMLARQPGIPLSSATIRSVLADLEALGYLDKPHTSAGRIPTDRGFRFYADALVRLRQVAGREKELIDLHYDGTRGLATSDVLLVDTSKLLHDLTRYTGVVSTPNEGERFRAIDFVRLRENRVLAVCVLGSGAVKNRVLTVDFPVDQDALNHASKYLTEILAEAKTLDEARQALSRELQSDRALYDQLSAQALVLGAKAFESDVEAPGVVMEGQTSLLGERTLTEDVQKLRVLFKGLEEKKRLMKLLERAVSAGELTLFIGDETGLEGGEGVAVIASPYRRGVDVLGAIGVIGPARMAYGRVIPIVEYTALALSRTLDDNAP